MISFLFAIGFFLFRCAVSKDTKELEEISTNVNEQKAS